MKKTRKKITILAVGDHVDYDAYRKFNKESRFMRENGFDYKNLPYDRFLKGEFPRIDTEKVIIFIFFPFNFWNKNIEHRNYKGMYGDYGFCRKFSRIARKLTAIVRYSLPDKKIFLINDPRISAAYRDKPLALDTLSENGVTVPTRIRGNNVRNILSLLKKGHKLFIKPRCGSLGKGMTFLELGNWQTNFGFRKGRIISRKSDRGWRFHGITGNKAFLSNLLKKDVFAEEAVDLLNIKGDKVDFRVYTFFDKALYVYPRRNSMDAVTTNITQGGHGDPHILDIIPKKLLSKVKKTAVKAARTLKLNFAGVDVIIDNSLKQIYVVDVNMFPGFPKRRTLNLSRCMVRELKRLKRIGALRYEKGCDL